MSFNSTFELVICSKYRATVLCFMWFSVINIIIDCRYYRNLLIYYTLIVVSIWDSKYRDTIEYNKKTFPPFVSAFNFSFFSLNFHNEMFPELEVGADLHRHVFTINQNIVQIAKHAIQTVEHTVHESLKTLSRVFEAHR